MALVRQLNQSHKVSVNMHDKGRWNYPGLGEKNGVETTEAWRKPISVPPNPIQLFSD